MSLSCRNKLNNNCSVWHFVKVKTNLLYGFLVCNDKLRSPSFVDQLGIGLHPHPFVGLTEEPENCQSSLTSLNHCCRKQTQKNTIRVCKTIIPSYLAVLIHQAFGGSYCCTKPTKQRTIQPFFSIGYLNKYFKSISQLQRFIKTWCQLWFFWFKTCQQPLYGLKKNKT